MINGHPVCALLDSGSLGDFMSSSLAEQLAIKQLELDTPLSLQLAVQGSQSKVNSRAVVRLEYQEIKEECSFDIININNYDLILGTPWLYQHRVCIGFNLARIMVGSGAVLPLTSGKDTRPMVATMTP